MGELLDVATADDRQPPLDIATAEDRQPLVWRTAPGAFVDAEGWARHASGRPLSRVDACGKLPLRPPAASNSVPLVTLTHPIAPVSSKFSYKFFHWLVEALPRVALLIAAEPSLLQPGKPTPDQPRLLVSCKGAVIRETLAILGVAPSRVLCWRPGRVYATSAPGHLLYPAPAPCGGATRRALRVLRWSALPPQWRPLASPADVYASGAILLHRRDGMRRLSNHAAVLTAVRASAALGNLPITVLNGSGTLRSQVAHFRRARCQLGPHGAGMALMIFAPPGVFGTAEVTPGAYFVSIRGKAGARDRTSGRSVHLNRVARNRSTAWVGHPQPNACYRGLAASLGMRHEWIVVPGASANEDLAPEPSEVVRMAVSMCTRPDAMATPRAQLAEQEMV